MNMKSMNITKFIILGLLLILVSCVGSKEAVQQYKEKREAFNRNPNPAYIENIDYYFDICERALFEGVISKDELIARGFVQNKINLAGAPIYNLRININLHGLSIIFPYKRDPNVCRIIFNRSIGITEFFTIKDAFGPFKQSALNAGYKNNGLFYTKGEKKIKLDGKLSRFTGDASYSMRLAISKL